MISLAIVVHDVQYAVEVYQNKHCASTQLRIDLKAVEGEFLIFKIFYELNYSNIYLV